MIESWEIRIAMVFGMFCFGYIAAALHDIARSLKQMESQPLNPVVNPALAQNPLPPSRPEKPEVRWKTKI